MSNIDVQAAIQAMHQKKIAPLYFLIGEERYFSRRCINHLRHVVVAEELSEFNEETFYATDANLEKVAESLQTLPMMAESRLVILREAHLLSDKDWAHLDEAYEKVFKMPLLSKASSSQASSDAATTSPPRASSSASPSVAASGMSLSDGVSSATLPSCVFVIQAAQVDKRKKVIKKWLDQATVIECKTPQETARAPWIRNLAKEKGLELDQEALAYLVQMGGNSLDELERDLEQVFLFLGGPHGVTIGDLAQVLQRNREENIFSLSESIGKKDRTQALFLFHRLKSQGENEIALVALVARHLRILLKLREGQATGMKGLALATQAGINNYFLQSYLQQAQLWTKETLSQALVMLADLDRQLKSSPLPGELWFERFIVLSMKEKERLSVKL